MTRINFPDNAFLNSPPPLFPPPKGPGQSVSPGPAFRIRTKTPISEIMLKRIFRSSSLISLKANRLGAYLALGAMLGTASIPGRVFGQAGDSVGNKIISRSDAITGVVADQSAPYSNSYWMNQSGEIWSGGNGETYTASGEKILDSLDTNDIWQYLAQGEISGDKHFIMFNDTEDKVYIRNSSTGAKWGCWTYVEPNPEYIRGLDIKKSNNEIFIYNQGWEKIEIFSSTGTHLDDMLLTYPTIRGGDGIVINPNDGSIIMNN